MSRLDEFLRSHYTQFLAVLIFLKSCVVLQRICSVWNFRDVEDYNNSTIIIELFPRKIASNDTAKEVETNYNCLLCTRRVYWSSLEELLLHRNLLSDFSALSFPTTIREGKCRIWWASKKVLDALVQKILDARCVLDYAPNASWSELHQSEPLPRRCRILFEKDFTFLLVHFENLRIRI
jgi:hypothetical protein